MSAGAATRVLSGSPAARSAARAGRSPSLSAGVPLRTATIGVSSAAAVFIAGSGRLSLTDSGWEKYSSPSASIRAR